MIRPAARLEAAYPLWSNARPRAATQLGDGCSGALRWRFEQRHRTTDEILASFWREALNVSEVGATDNFFDLGRHSLLFSGPSWPGQRVAASVIFALSSRRTCVCCSFNVPVMNRQPGTPDRDRDDDQGTDPGERFRFNASDVDRAVRFAMDGE